VLPIVDGYGELKLAKAIMLVKLIRNDDSYVWNEDEGSPVPSWCKIEAQWCIGVCNVEYCVVVCLVGNEHIIVRKIVRDDRAINELFEKASKHVSKFII
jgi:hypothetical protein